jgi:hypothetical protein
MVWCGVDWIDPLVIEISRGSCRHDNEPSGFIKCWGNSWGAEQLAASQEGHSSMGLVIVENKTESKN